MSIYLSNCELHCKFQGFTVLYAIFYSVLFGEDHKMPYNIFFTSRKLFWRLRKWNQTKLKTSGLKFRCLQLHKAIFFCMHLLHFGTIILIQIYGHWWLLPFGKSECSAFQDNFIPSVFLSQMTACNLLWWIQNLDFQTPDCLYYIQQMTGWPVSFSDGGGVSSWIFVSYLCFPTVPSLSLLSKNMCAIIPCGSESNGLHALIASLEKKKKKEKSVIFHWSYQKDFLQLDDFCVPHFVFSFKFQAQMNPK